jgi:hypothetical protein
MTPFVHTSYNPHFTGTSSSYKIPVCTMYDSYTSYSFVHFVQSLFFGHFFIVQASYKHRRSVLYDAVLLSIEDRTSYTREPPAGRKEASATIATPSGGTVTYRKERKPALGSLDNDLGACS